MAFDAACHEIDRVLMGRSILLLKPYPLGTTIFWGAIVPAAISILLVFGHELWRRICPLSFLSQIPRALGWQRQFKRENSKTGKMRYELAKVNSNSWLGRNYPDVQFSWLFVGLVVGYFCYYYLYAGNWNYYFSGAWLRQTDRIASLFDPRLYLFGQAIDIPKLIAVPLVLGGCTAICYWVGRSIEKRAKSYSRRQDSTRSLATTVGTGIETIRHRIFTLCTFGIFNFFFIFGGRPLVQLMPWSVQYLYPLPFTLSPFPFPL